MPTTGKGRLFVRKDGKFLMYLPKSLCEDSMFPFKNWQISKGTGVADSIPVRISFKIGAGKKQLLVEDWEEEPSETLK